MLLCLASCARLPAWHACSAVLVMMTRAATPLLRAHAHAAHAGVETIHPIGTLSDYESEILAAMKPELMSSIEKGIKFVKEN